MADVSLMAVPSEDAPTCANCGAELVADQRYCLACGHAVSPVRLAFLDVLGEQQSGSSHGTMPATIDMAPLAWGPAGQQGFGGWLRRNNGLLSLLAVLVLCLVAGLLVGHWVTQKNGTTVPATQTVKIEGLSGLASGAAGTSTETAGTSTTGAAATKSSAKSATKEPAQTHAQEAKIENAKPPPAIKATPDLKKKLLDTHGKKHEEEVNKLGSAPIEG